MSEHTTIYSVCGMCGVRCPLAVDVEDGEVRWLYGNPHSPLRGALCARGAAGIALENDDERPKGPLLRTGERGAGSWKTATWDEALDFVAERLETCRKNHGPESVLWSDRDGPFTDLQRAFMRGLGSPNVCTHGVSCDLNIHHAAQAVTGFGRGKLVQDYDRCRHLVLQGRNLFESINVAEAGKVMAALQKGCRLSVLDVRPTVTAAKADDFYRVRPGTDYAFNLAVIHVLLHENLYQKEYVEAHTRGVEALTAFVRPYTPQWAEQETGVPAAALRELAHRLAEAAPHVIWHPGWMTTRYSQSFQVSRTALVITALLGGIGADGGIVPGSDPAAVGRRGLQRLSALYPAPRTPRADGVGGEYKAFDPAKGLLHRAFAAMESGVPYPVKAYIAWRHDPLQALPDPEAMKRAFAHLDLLVSVTFSWSDTAWHSDVILPLSPYLARESIIASKGGFKPQFFLRRRAVQPRFDTRADWEIISGLSRRLGLDKLAFDRVEDLWNYQLEGTGVRLEDFDATGFVELTDTPRRPDLATLAFPTPSGKIELDSAAWEAASGVPGLAPYISPAHPPKGAFRLTFGRIAVHTQGHTINNPLLAEQMPENVIWLHPDPARELGIAAGDRVEVLDALGRGAGDAAVHLTEGMHPEAVFLVHGFGHRLPCESRAYGRGVADQELIPGGLERQDPGGGGLALQEAFVTLRKVEARS